ncbi:MAG: PQQ-dependent dehydrogenase, methanol/ethanol family [Pseudomonadales bacterium]|nr:PQQ-dependent dehydrogenase, methanol/ethanol family [Pseudomonadales bacterium]
MMMNLDLIRGVVSATAICVATNALSQVVTDINDNTMADESAGENWLAFGRTYSEQRFSPLDQINTGNVASLQPDWYIDLPNSRSLVSTPLVVDGVLYFIGGMNVVRAIDATSGEELWRYDPRVAERASRRMRAGWDNSRGIGLWEDKVFVATWDGRLIGVDRHTGEEIWSAQTIDPDLAMYITGAPKVFKGKVLIGNGGTEHGPNRGYVTAYDANTGEQAWRFYIVPGNPDDGFENEAMAMAAETWTGEWWLHGGGGNAWHGFTYDVELDQLYIGTGNGSPWNRQIRSPGGGDNLFLCSVVALDPDTGDYLWHYQTTPGDTWDYNSNMDIVLADLPIDGESVPALMHAPKNGFFYVIDRRDGSLISAEPYVPTTWASTIDLVTGRPIENPGVRYETAPARIAPSSIGGHSWHAMSYNPQTGLVYIPSIFLATGFSNGNIDIENYRNEQWRFDMAIGSGPGGGPTREFPGALQAWDPVRQEMVWEVPADGVWNAGTLTTASNLVFQGRADGHLIAYNAESGEQLWDYDLGLGISAPPITYSVADKQYLAILVGWGGSMAALGGSGMAQYGWAYGAQTRRLVAFSLDGSTALPAQAPPTIPQPLLSSDFVVDPQLAQSAAENFATACMWCHGGGAISSGMAPDLRASAIPLSAAAFEQVVRGGALMENGMPPFSDFSDEQLEGLRHYIRAAAERTATVQ